jgi:GTPase SAR1 family protein
MYFRGAHGAVVVYDIANRSTFDNVRRWLKDIRKYALYLMLSVSLSHIAIG